MTIERKVLDQVRPPDEQIKKLEQVTRDLCARVRDIGQYFDINVEPFVAGSVAKDTHLRDPDVDIFILFPPDVPLEELTAKGMDIARSIIDGEEKYAQHPYLQGTFEGFSVDMVPAYRLKDTKSLMTAVDRTPFHVKYVNNTLLKEQHDEVRLFKAFLKGIGKYGAEETVQGFSGYLVELMVIHFGTFHAALKGLSAYVPGTQLDTFHLLRDDDVPDPEDVGRFDDAMVFIDPVDHKRNVASPVSLETLGFVIMAVREYLKRPRMTFFFPNPPDVLSRQRLEGLMTDRETTLVGIEIPKFHENADVIHGQLRKAVRAITRMCNRSGFPVLHSSYNVLGKKCIMLFEFEVSHLPVVYVHHGPRVGEGNEAEFMEKWGSSERTLVGPYIEEGFWKVDVIRSQTTVEDLLYAEIPTLSLGKHINAEVSKDLIVMSANDLMHKMFRPTLTTFFLRTPPWLWGVEP
ncbi:MAG: CCA tRNA nucleotidyltransferase, partial [Thermoplasmata archaeon]